MNDLEVPGIFRSWISLEAEAFILETGMSYFQILNGGLLFVGSTYDPQTVFGAF